MNKILCKIFGHKSVLIIHTHDHHYPEVKYKSQGLIFCKRCLGIDEHVYLKKDRLDLWCDKRIDFFQVIEKPSFGCISKQAQGEAMSRFQQYYEECKSELGQMTAEYEVLTRGIADLGIDLSGCYDANDVVDKLKRKFETVQEAGVQK